MYRVVQEKIFPIPERLGFRSPLHLDIHKAIYFLFKFTNNLPDKSLHTVNPLDILTSIHANMPPLPFGHLLIKRHSPHPSLDGKNFFLAGDRKLFWNNPS